MKRHASPTKPSLGEQLAQLQTQFEGLDPKNPAAWPIVPRVLLCTALVLLTLALVWFAHLRDKVDDLAAEHQVEQSLQNEYREKLAKAVNLDMLKHQRQQVQRYVAQLEKQLPGQAEIAAVLFDVNTAGVGRNLQFEIFRPGTEVVRDYYVELPITVRVLGQFHDLSAFMADVARLSRIVTVSDISIEPTNKSGSAREGQDSQLVLQAVVRTYRYLNDDELNANRAKAAGNVPVPFPES